MALGPRGNNFVTGGKLAHMNAEEAYTVSLEVHFINLLRPFDKIFLIQIYVFLTTFLN